MIEEEILRERAKTCCFSGHRNLSKNFSPKSLEIIIEKLIKGGFNRFLIGMAIGFDTVCYDILIKLKQKHDIKIVACIPCPEQAKNFNKEQFIKYNEMLNNVDEKRILSEKYTASCMLKRNKYMVDNSSLLVCYFRQEFGGTFNTYKYAQEKGVAIIRI